jgi:hypothetical protein
MRLVYLTIAFRIRHKKILSPFRGLEKNHFKGWRRMEKRQELFQPLNYYTANSGIFKEDEFRRGGKTRARAMARYPRKNA